MANLKYKHTAYTSAQWASLNPVIVENEIVIESDTKRTKIGNGISTYNQLEYADANSIGNSLGSIKPTDAAPTPARNGNYTFSIGGNKPAWLTAETGITTVKAGDGVSVVYTAPSGYSYTHVDTGSWIEQVRSQSTGNVPSSKLLDDSLFLKLDKNQIFGDSENILLYHDDLDLTQNKYIASADGEIKDNSGAYFATISTLFTREIYISADKPVASNNVRGLVFYDKDGNKLKPLRANGVECSTYRVEDLVGDSIFTGIIKIPTNAVKLLIQIKFDNNININNTIFTIPRPKINDYNINAPLRLLSSNFNSQTSIKTYVGSEMAVLENYYIDSLSGLEISNVGSIISPYIPVGLGNIYISGDKPAASNNVRALVFYDKDGNKLKPLRANGVECSTYRVEDLVGESFYTNAVISIPNGAVSFRFNIKYNGLVDVSKLIVKIYETISDIDLINIQRSKGFNNINRFQVSINCNNMLTSNSNSVSESQDSELIYNDWGVLMLPNTYSTIGRPTPLVIGCHGGGGTVTGTGSQVEGVDIYKYLLMNGYAVMDVAGMPLTYSITQQIDQYRVMGCPFALNSYQKAYDYVVNNYNISRNGVYLNGGSNGGLTALNIAAHTSIPIKALAGMSPLLSLENAWNIPTGAMSGGLYSQYQNRANMIKLYGMNPISSQEQLNNATIEFDKIKGFDPYNYNIFTDISGNKCIIRNCPIKIWQPINDPVIEISKARDFVERIKNAGGYAILREMETGYHAPESAGDIIGTFLYNGYYVNLYPAMHELLMWFNRFN